MATKYGFEAWLERAKMKASFKAVRNTVAGVVLLVVLWLVFTNYVG